MLEAATNYLASRLANVTAVDVVYNKPDDFGGSSASIKATRGATPFEMQSEDGVITRIESRDFITAASEFPFDLPASGDTISDEDDIFEVLSMPGIPPYRFSDAGRSLLRIHTKKVDVSD